MKTIYQWLQEYGESHRNPTNILIHKICVPAILFATFGLLWGLPVPSIFNSLPLNFNWAIFAFIAVLIFYLRLSLSLTLGFVIEGLLMLLLWKGIEIYVMKPVWPLALSIFILSWVVQIYGHKIEGKKPSFMKDLQFLLIGPLWTLKSLYQCLGLKY